jgi:hypothetical protein
VLNRVIEAPTVRPDGSILDAPGYDSKTQLFFDPGACVFEPVPDEPTRDDALAALAVLKEPFEEFPFVEESDRSVALAAVMTALVRPSIRSSPLFLFRAPKMASGKSLLQDIVALVATGRDATVMSQATNDEEDRKRLLSVLMEGRALGCIDNIERPLESAALCSILTQQTYSDRVLGASKMIVVPTSTTWLATGNNVVVKGDLVSRVVTCDIDPKTERPEERTFKRKLRPFVSVHRGALVAAALTMLRAYYIAGRPVQDLSAFGRFEDWSDLVRSTLVWLGEQDPCLGRERLRFVDPVAGEILAVLQAWDAVIGERPVKVSEVLHHAGRTGEQATVLREALQAVAADDDGKLDSRRLGQWLGHYANRIEGGLMVLRSKLNQGSQTWKVVHV